MKQFITTGLVLVYITALAGIPMDIHFCRGDVVSVGILLSGEACCCDDELENTVCCNAEPFGQTFSRENTDACCSNEYYSIQYLDDKQVPKNKITNFRQGKEQVLNRPVKIFQPEEDDSFRYGGFHDPPPINNVPLWLLNCTLTFYG